MWLYKQTNESKSQSSILLSYTCFLFIKNVDENAHLLVIGDITPQPGLSSAAAIVDIPVNTVSMKLKQYYTLLWKDS